MGIELGAAIVGFCLLGVWIDHRYETGPYGTLICALLGIVGGMFNFIRQALQAVKDEAPPEDSRQDGEP
jgi:F0F1-type ATP synthase assembly protein I